MKCRQAGIFTRVAASHLRVGTFQYFATRQDHEGLRMLADFAIQRHYPQIEGSTSPYTGLLEEVIAAQANPDLPMDGAGLYPRSDEH